MKYLRPLLAALLLALTYVSVASAQSGYSPDQLRVIAKIYAACDAEDARAGVTVPCTNPLAIARRESGFGADKTGDWSNSKGRDQSIGIFQWHENGLGASGEYYARYGLAWRWNEDLDIERGVRLTTQHLRGLGPDLVNCTCGWWTPKGLNTWGLPGRPAGYGGGPPLPTATPEPEPEPEPLPELPRHKLVQLDLWEE